MIMRFMVLIKMAMLTSIVDFCTALIVAESERLLRAEAERERPERKSTAKVNISIKIKSI
ncbi:hypothetical protein [Jeotgalibacillus soli]|uniref:hypothetical protein n=1 Tax=Jeotgalibacillus soli TaxID=889306 RepID=UPI0005976EF0|nr:hypothetical protein [Jeotgalibacillus soli]